MEAKPRFTTLDAGDGIGQDTESVVTSLSRPSVPCFPGCDPQGPPGKEVGRSGKKAGVGPQHHRLGNLIKETTLILFKENMV